MKRNVFALGDTGSYYVSIRGGFMEDCDYVEGGRVESR